MSAVLMQTLSQTEIRVFLNFLKSIYEKLSNSNLSTCPPFHNSAQKIDVHMILI